MKIIKHVPAILLALVFFGFGMAHFLHLMPTPPMTGDAATFGELLGKSGYMEFVKVLEVIGGLLLFFPRTRGIGICIIAPVVLNILCFEVFIDKKPGIGVALMIVTIIAIYFEKDRFKSIWS